MTTLFSICFETTMKKCINNESCSTQTSLFFLIENGSVCSDAISKYVNVWNV